MAGPSMADGDAGKALVLTRFVVSEIASSVDRP